MRSRAIRILAANVKWADEAQLDAWMNELLLHVNDEKPITARQCIQALPEIAAAQPWMIPHIRRALESADLSNRSDSMRPLFSKDIRAVLERLP